MITTDLNATLTEIRSAREAGDTARAVVYFAMIAHDLREELAEFAGLDGKVDEDGKLDSDLVRQSVKDICELPATADNAPIFAALHALLAGDNVEPTYSAGRWRLAYEVEHLGHYVYEGEPGEDFYPETYGLTLCLSQPDTHWMEPCEATDEALLTSPTWDADEGTGDIVCAFPVNGKWAAWVQVR